MQALDQLFLCFFLIEYKYELIIDFFSFRDS